MGEFLDNAARQVKISNRNWGVDSKKPMSAHADDSKHSNAARNEAAQTAEVIKDKCQRA